MIDITSSRVTFNIFLWWALQGTCTGRAWYKYCGLCGGDDSVHGSGDTCPSRIHQCDPRPLHSLELCSLTLAVSWSGLSSGFLRLPAIQLSSSVLVQISRLSPSVVSGKYNTRGGTALEEKVTSFWTAGTSTCWEFCHCCRLLPQVGQPWVSPLWLVSPEYGPRRHWSERQSLEKGNKARDI